MYQDDLTLKTSVYWSVYNRPAMSRTPIILLSIFISAISCEAPQLPLSPLDALKISVPREFNRAVSFTNKEAAYYYTQTHVANHPEHSDFEGMNVATKRIFGGYDLFADEQGLDNQKSEVLMYPYKLVRKHESGLTEELWMLDNRNIIEVGLTGADESIGIALKGQGINLTSQTSTIVFLSSMEGNYSIAVSTKTFHPITAKDNKLSAEADAGGFYIAVAKSDSEAEALIRATQQNIITLKGNRVRRMERFLEYNAFVESNLDSLNLALNWLNMTMNQLVTKQEGDGIYTGLPWSNKYASRGELIAFPGAMLVSGQFEAGRRILKSLAEYQNKDKSSIFIGRVPIILDSGNLDYHTADATPKLVIELENYLKYSGDTSLIQELYPMVVNSIEGATKNWVDGSGYLIHNDHETWMDARDINLIPYSPRGNRANDVQALWYRQLRAGAYFAEYMGDTGNQKKWTALAEKLKANFQQDYLNSEQDYLADRLTKDSKTDFKLRPNQLFALDMIDDLTRKAKILKKVWEELVYPWGVSTLDSHDPSFRPFHLSPEYPKDAARHNGAIWPWLNGIAMQRMIESGQTETAYALFKSMNRLALNRGAIGGLSENLDAYPAEGQALPQQTGGFLHAWSNAEQLRIWNQWFLGIRPDLTNNSVTLAPRIPEEITELEYRSLVGESNISDVYKSSATTTHTYRFNNLRNLTISVDIYPYEIAKFNIKPRYTLEVKQTEESLTLTLRERGNIIKVVTPKQSAERMKEGALYDDVLRGVKFAMPLDHHPVVIR